MAYPTRFMDELRSRTSLMSVVAKRVKLTKRGKEFIGLCPFHNEKTPSFHVVEDKDFYHCFGCGAHGDAITFMMEAGGLSFVEAIESLANDANLEVPQQSAAERQKEEKKIGLYDIVELACAFFAKSLYSPQGQQALNYLYSRGLSDSTIKHFRLGYAPPDNTGNDGLYEHLKSHNVDDKDMDDLGLVRFNERGNYSFFRDRVMFTICDDRGKSIAFGGRFMGDAKAAKVGKYVNSPDTPLFDKGFNLYNLHNAKTVARKSNHIIVAEGYMDVIAMAQVGITNAVAPLGTATTVAQLQKLWKIADEPVMCFDGDDAGRGAGLRAAERALPNLIPGKSLQFCFLPDGLDPDDFIIERGVNALKEYMADTIPLVQVVWDEELARKPIITPEQQADFEKRIMGRALQINNGDVQSYYRDGYKNWIWEKIKRANSGKSDGKFGQSLWSNNRGKNNRGYGKPVNSMNKALKATQQSLSRRRQQVVLAIGINHPSITNLYWDQYESMPLDKDLDSLRTALLSALMDNSHSTGDDLAQILGQTHDKTLSDILSPALYMLAPAAKPDGDPSHAQTVLDDILSIDEQQSMHQHLNTVRHDTASDTDTKWEKINSINKTLHSNGEE